MKKIFTFEERVMNGTVTASSATACFATSELAEKAQQAIIAANRVPDKLGLRYWCGDIKETNVFETEDEVPILREEKKNGFRTIRFRGKDAKTGEWLYGGLFHMPDGSPCIVNVIRNHAGKPVFDYKGVRPETVGQFTGLKDRSGYEIWEGDIVKCKYNDEYYLYNVIYTNLNNLFAYFTLVDSEGCHEKLSDPDEMEVIGNIYDNPELIKRH